MSPGVTVNPALAELPVMYPTAEGFHDGTDERRAKFSADEWAGIDSFPFLSAELSLLAVSDRVIDVPGELGPPSMLSRTRTTGLPAKPNWYPRGRRRRRGRLGGDRRKPGTLRCRGPGLGAGGHGRRWAPGTFHRGTALTLPRGARHTIHLAYRLARVEWGQRMAWVSRSHEPAWY
jgi:hypothetical protein